MYDIVVLGAGVVGLSTAVNIQDQVPNRQVTLIADKFNEETTSDGAAGIFRPTLRLTPAKSTEQFKKWCTDSFSWYHEVNTKYNPNDTGVIRVSGYEFSDTPKERPYHHDIQYDFRDLTAEELKNLPGNHKFGWFFTTLMTECRRYLPWLAKRFISNGGKIEQRTVNDIKEVKAPWLKHFYVINSGQTYIYTGQDNVVLGGTRHPNEIDDGDSENEKYFNDVYQRCLEVLPSLKGCEIMNKWIGLRPHRAIIRIEPETFNFNGEKMTVVHNYGHGANGVALSWGTAIHAASIVKDLLSATKNSPSAKL